MNNWNQQLQCTNYNQDLDLTNSYKRDNQIVSLADWEAKKQPTTDSFFSIQVNQVLFLKQLVDNDISPHHQDLVIMLEIRSTVGI